ncbi:MAG TPA: class I SAM-dependent methyltransferase, partial [Bacillales bacterium]|nr:class I SAM-dependent methyltransferase [Bacillales bacterium]
VGMLNPSRKMDVENAEAYSERHEMDGFERETLLKWSNVSTRRHRYDSEQLTTVLEEAGASEIEHHEVLDGLAIVTVAKVE